MPEVRVRQADLEDPDDRETIVALTDAYARDPMGGGEPLPDEVRGDLVEAMQEHGNVVVWLAERDGDPVGISGRGDEGSRPERPRDAEHEDRERARHPVGILTGIVTFSTFAASSTLNVHDIAVLDDRRGDGIGAKLLQAAEAWAREEDLARMSLEVLEENPAQRLYEREGFEDKARYMVKPLDEAGDSYAGER
jgi:GNAT superfamily N-acetyltransferase